MLKTNSRNAKLVCSSRGIVPLISALSEVWQVIGLLWRYRRVLVQETVSEAGSVTVCTMLKRVHVRTIDRYLDRVFNSGITWLGLQLRYPTIRSKYLSEIGFCAIKKTPCPIFSHVVMKNSFKAHTPKQLLNIKGSKKGHFITGPTPIYVGPS